MKKKPLFGAIMGFSIGIALFATLGFTAGGASTGARMLVATSDGNAYYYNGKTVYYLDGTSAKECKINKNAAIFQDNGTSSIP